MLSGILLFGLMKGLDISLMYGTSLPDTFVTLLAVLLAVYGFILGFQEMRGAE